MDCMHRAPYFRVLSEQELEEINRDRYSVRYKPGEMILKQGTSASHVLSLIDGTVKIYIEGIGDKNLLLSLQQPWALLGGPGLHTDGKIHYSISALSGATICYIKLENYNRVMELNSRFASQLIQHISSQAVMMFNKVVSLTQKQMHGRMADGLLYLANDFYRSSTFEVQLSRQEIGDLTAMSKDSAIRILKDFERDGIISLNGSMLTVMDMEQLYDISLKG